MEYNLNSVTAMIGCLCFILLDLPCISAFLCEESTDCLALLKFKEGLSSDPKGHLQTWKEGNPICNWTGITCHPNLQDRVIGLELIDMDLQGQLSPFISNLSLLTTLSLQGNRIYGQIPASLGGLSELAFLNISENNLEGNIPGSLYGCQSLKVLDLNYNNLTGVFPEELNWMKNLTYLRLSQNNLTGELPSSLSNLTELTLLELSTNYFTGKIPPQLGELRKLEILYLHLNFLDGPVPAAISNCTALREISLIGNLLTGEIPSDLGTKLQNLQKMYMLGNKLSGRIPVTLSNLSQLTLLDLSINKLEGEVPAELGMLKNLEILYFHSNSLGGGGGSDNSSLGFLTALTNCSLLRKLHLASCQFRGSIPSSVGGLSNDLFYFNLMDNDITGSIPDSFGNLSNLVTAYLSINYLEGKIPASIGKLGNLQRLNLEKNRILGPIPDDLGKMSSLGLLDLGTNLIGGFIPPSLGNLSQLRYLNLSSNRLSGNFPIELTQCSLMMMLDLSFNILQGSVPSQIGLLSQLDFSLNVSNNHFEGQVPKSIGKMVSLKAIDFSNNSFSGVIPSLIGSCISLVYLNLSNNMLNGTISESLKLLSYLEVLDLSHNELNGTVPVWIADEPMIKILNLSYNRLSGEVPNAGNITVLNSTSFLGNVGLCGGAELLGLPPCEVQKQKEKINDQVIYSAVAAVAVGCALVAVFVLCFFCRNGPKPADGMLMAPLWHHGSRTFTQRELETATLGFNEAYLVGRGTFGSVYKAVIDNGEAIVAVKVLHGEANLDNNQSFKSFKRECEILSEIKHRNLVGLVGYAWNTGFKALILEFIGNGNLGQHLYPGTGLEEAACKLTLRERISIAVDIANGLEYLQEGCPVQVIHCDLKPENVLINTTMVAHVADFGIGKLISADKSKEHASTTGFVRGSIGYIPPEYGQGIEVSAKGDVYSFGVVLLELITRKRPTSNMFTSELDLRKWVGSAFPDQILDVVDTTLKQEARLRGTRRDLEKLEECSVGMLEVGMMCTEENPRVDLLCLQLCQC